MLADALNHIRSQFLEEKIQKFPDKAEAERRFNYPYIAIEEALTNAVYHRSYEIREPIEVRILPDRITIGSFPGPDRSITDKDIQKCLFISRRYRNRRIGEFLKELDMTEGRGTGMPKILQAIRKNDSPQPIFHTDEDRSYFVVELSIHPKFLKKGEQTVEVRPGAESRAESRAESVIVIKILNSAFLSMREIAKSLNKKTITGSLKRTIKKLIDDGLIEYTIPGKPSSRLQKYRLTAKGKKIKANL